MPKQCEILSKKHGMERCTNDAVTFATTKDGTRYNVCNGHALNIGWNLFGDPARRKPSKMYSNIIAIRGKKAYA